MEAEMNVDITNLLNNAAITFANMANEARERAAEYAKQLSGPSKDDQNWAW